MEFVEDRPESADAAALPVKPATKGDGKARCNHPGTGRTEARR
jgi:hypothetical protein